MTFAEQLKGASCQHWKLKPSIHPQNRQQLGKLPHIALEPSPERLQFSLYAPSVFAFSVQITGQGAN